MAENPTGMTRRDAERQLIERSMRDPDFRRQLSSDPKRAVFDELGFEIPPGYNVRVLEEDASTMYLVLPAAAGEGELSDLELEAVAGGKTPPPTVKCTTAGGSSGQMPNTTTDCQ